jgi:hypothetical protein
VRKPLANILAIAELLQSPDSLDKKELAEFLKESSLELDNMLKKIAEKASFLTAQK